MIPFSADFGEPWLTVVTYIVLYFRHIMLSEK